MVAFTGEIVYNMGSESAWNPLTLTGQFFITPNLYSRIGHSSVRKVNARGNELPLAFGFQATLRTELCLFFVLRTDEHVGKP